MWKAHWIPLTSVQVMLHLLAPPLSGCGVHLHEPLDLRGLHPSQSSLPTAEKTSAKPQTQDKPAAGSTVDTRAMATDQSETVRLVSQHLLHTHYEPILGSTLTARDSHCGGETGRGPGEDTLGSRGF